MLVFFTHKSIIRFYFCRFFVVFLDCVVGLALKTNKHLKLPEPKLKKKHNVCKTKCFVWQKKKYLILLVTVRGPAQCVFVCVFIYFYDTNLRTSVKHHNL